MTHKISTQWKKQMAFESDIFGHPLLMDADEASGGENRAPRPKPLLLAALAGCTGMDVVSLINKMRLEIDDLDIDIHGEMTSEHPKHYHSIKVIYSFTGPSLNHEKLQKAVDMSQQKYCGVSYMLRKACDLTYEIKFKDT